MERQEGEKDFVYLLCQFPTSLVNILYSVGKSHSVTHLVGETMIAPTLCFLMGVSNRSNFSTMGIKKAMVFPLPVTASTTTSLWPMNSGIVDAWTGVMRLKPMDATASMIHSASGGVRASHERECEDLGLEAIAGIA